MKNKVVYASSSAYNIIPFLHAKSQLTIVTSGVKALTKAGEYGITVYSTGGKLISSCLSLIGDNAYETIAQYNADICFISCRGLSEDGWLTGISSEENLVRRHMLKQSKTRVLLCDSKKFGQKYSSNLCHLKDIDVLISEKELPEYLAEYSGIML